MFMYSLDLTYLCFYALAVRFVVKYYKTEDRLRDAEIKKKCD